MKRLKWKIFIKRESFHLLPLSNVSLRLQHPWEPMTLNRGVTSKGAILKSNLWSVPHTNPSASEDHNGLLLWYFSLLNWPWWCNTEKQWRPFHTISNVSRKRF